MPSTHPMMHPNMVHHRTESSPAYTGDIHPTQLLSRLDTFCEQLRHNPSGETIEAIQQVLKSWEIITMSHDGQDRWLPVPLFIRKTIIRHPLSHRIVHLIKTGEWKSERTARTSIEGAHQSVVPFRVPTSNENKHGILTDKIPALLVTLIHMRSLIRGMVDVGATSVGVFEKPNGVINRNRLRAWFDANEYDNEWTMKHSLSVQNLHRIVNSASFSSFK